MIHNRMSGADRTRLSRSRFAANIERLKDREASLVTIVDVARAQLGRVRAEIEQATETFHVKRGSE